ncbi:MAG: hypothetical protein QM214_01570 [Bacillota bacterium]|jgi:hypothetical protein|nr:hypothetical protein [Bacillota bacterium]
MKKTLYSLFILLLVFVFAIALIACDEPILDENGGDEEEETVARSQLITNGTFYDISNTTGSQRYIKENVASWELSSGSLTRASEGVIYGGIDLKDEELFNANRNTFSKNNTLEYPGVDPETPAEKDDPDTLQDTNALLLASINEAGSLFYKNTSDFNLDPNKYYRLQFSVLTDIDMTDVDKADRDKKGAWVIIDGAVYAEFKSINTEGKWQKFEVYIESSNYESRAIRVRLWLGHGPQTVKKKDNVYSTKGAVLFDNIICTEISHDTYSSAQTGDKVQKTTMLFPDMEFVQQNELSVTSSPDYFYSFRSGSNSSLNTVNYNLVEGKEGLTSNKPPVDRPFTGIVDMSKLYRFDESEEGEDRFINTYKKDHNKVDFIAPDREDFMTNEGIFRLTAEREAVAGSLPEYKALMIFHDDLSGAGFTSKKQLLIRKNHFYTIKVWAYVWSIDLPEPPKSEVGTQPTEPDKDKPTQEAIDEAEDSMYTAQAEYYYRRIFEGEIEIDDIEDETLLEYIDSLSEERKEFLESDAVDLESLETNYSDEKDLYEELMELSKKWEDYEKKNAEYTEKYNDYMQKYWTWRDNNSVMTEDGYELMPKAEFRITGAGDLEAQKTTDVGVWQELTFYIRGNQLSDRKVNLEFWFGEGSNADYDTLMLGGVFFDNITIIESKSFEAGKDYQELSPFTQEDIESGNWDIGGLIDFTGDIRFDEEIEDEDDDLWEKSLAKGVSQEDKEYLNFRIVDDESFPIRIDDVDRFYNLLIMENTDFTASILNFRDNREILSNKCYRLSFWARTENLEGGGSIEIMLMSKASDSADDMAKATSISEFKSEEWQEVVFYLKGDTLKNNLVSLKVDMGSGNRFDTEKYVKGALHISAITLKEIKYSEYNASNKSGDKTKSHAFSNTSTSSTNSVTNGNFGSIDLGDIKEDAIDDKTGDLIGVAPTSSWSIPSDANITTNGYNKPSIEIKTQNQTYDDNDTDEHKYIVWKHVVDADGEKPDGYEVYIYNTIKIDDEGEEEDVESLYIGYVPTGSSATVNASTQAGLYRIAGEGDAEEWHYRFRITSKAKGFFGVKAVSGKGVGTRSDTIENSAKDDDSLAEVFDEFDGVDKKEYKIGTINYTTYNDGEYADIFEDSDYVSPYKTMLIIESNYNIRANVTAASKSLSANKWYEISVWVKTLNGARASISFEDISAVLETKDENIGFINQDTQGEWKQYRFYVVTGGQSSNIKLRLSMGNPYDRGRLGTDEDSTRMYDENALSKGTIFFDNVKVIELTQEEFEEKSKFGGEEGEFLNGQNEVFHVYEMVYDNKFAYKNLSYLTDSFDSYTENTETEEFDEDGEYNEGFYRGHTPNAYTWARATDGSTKDEERLYGVYNYQDVTNAHWLIGNDTNPDPFSDFMPEDFDLATFIRMSGYNSLVMSNLVENGQHYTLSSSRVLSDNKYYKLTFDAKTLLDEDTFAEFRFMYKGSDDEYDVIKINTSDLGIDRSRQYTMYIYNNESITQSVKWRFNLGGDGEDEKILGMLVIDNVRLAEIDSEEYLEAKRAFDELDEDERALSAIGFHVYDDDNDPGDNDPEPPKEPEKNPIFRRGDIWLLVSSIVLGAIIIITVLVVIIKRVRKKYPKKVKGENVVKTEKSLDITPVQKTDKVDVINEEEFVDKEEKPKYVQRVLPKKKKKKK